MLFFRILQHLLPRSQAWSLVVGSTIRRFFEGLTGIFESARTYVDLVYLDLFPATSDRGAPPTT